MFDETSRYYDQPTTTLTTPDGQTVRYVRRRLLPPADTLPLLAEVVLTQGDRLDLIAARTLNDPEQYWRICDANNALNPFDLESTPGRRLRVPLPQA